MNCAVELSEAQVGLIALRISGPDALENSRPITHVQTDRTHDRAIAQASAHRRVQVSEAKVGVALQVAIDVARVGEAYDREVLRQRDAQLDRTLPAANAALATVPKLARQK